jgi:hypothetical protein
MHRGSTHMPEPRLSIDKAIADYDRAVDKDLVATA